MLLKTITRSYELRLGECLQVAGHVGMAPSSAVRPTLKFGIDAATAERRENSKEAGAASCRRAIVEVSADIIHARTENFFIREYRLPSQMKLIQLMLYLKPILRFLEARPAWLQFGRITDSVGTFRQCIEEPLVDAQLDICFQTSHEAAFPKLATFGPLYPLPRSLSTTNTGSETDLQKAVRMIAFDAQEEEELELDLDEVELPSYLRKLVLQKPHESEASSPGPYPHGEANHEEDARKLDPTPVLHLNQGNSPGPIPFQASTQERSNEGAACKEGAALKEIPTKLVSTTLSDSPSAVPCSQEKPAGIVPQISHSHETAMHGSDIQGGNSTHEAACLDHAQPERIHPGTTGTLHEDDCMDIEGALLVYDEDDMGDEDMDALTPPAGSSLLGDRPGRYGMQAGMEAALRLGIETGTGTSGMEAGMEAGNPGDLLDADLLDADLLDADLLDADLLDILDAGFVRSDHDISPANPEAAGAGAEAAPRGPSRWAGSGPRTTTATTNAPANPEAAGAGAEAAPGGSSRWACSGYGTTTATTNAPTNPEAAGAGAEAAPGGSSRWAGSGPGTTTATTNAPDNPEAAGAGAEAAPRGSWRWAGSGPGTKTATTSAPTNPEAAGAGAEAAPGGSSRWAGSGPGTTTATTNAPDNLEAAGAGAEAAPGGSWRWAGSGAGDTTAIANAPTHKAPLILPRISKRAAKYSLLADAMQPANSQLPSPPPSGPANPASISEAQDDAGADRHALLAASIKSVAVAKRPTILSMPQLRRHKGSNFQLPTTRKQLPRVVPDDDDEIQDGINSPMKVPKRSEADEDDCITACNEGDDVSEIQQGVTQDPAIARQALALPVMKRSRPLPPGAPSQHGASQAPILALRTTNPAFGKLKDKGNGRRKTDTTRAHDLSRQKVPGLDTTSSEDIVSSGISSGSDSDFLPARLQSQESLSACSAALVEALTQPPGSKPKFKPVPNPEKLLQKLPSLSLARPPQTVPCAATVAGGELERRTSAAWSYLEALCGPTHPAVCRLPPWPPRHTVSDALHAEAPPAGSIWKKYQPQGHANQENAYQQGGGLIQGTDSGMAPVCGQSGGSTLQPAALLPPSELAEPGLDDDLGDDFWDEFDLITAAAVSTVDPIKAVTAVEPIKAVTALEHLHMHHQSGQRLGAQATSIQPEPGHHACHAISDRPQQQSAGLVFDDASPLASAELVVSDGYDDAHQTTAQIPQQQSAGLAFGDDSPGASAELVLGDGPPCAASEVAVSDDGFQISLAAAAVAARTRSAAQMRLEAAAADLGFGYDEDMADMLVDLAEEQSSEVEGSSPKDIDVGNHDAVYQGVGHGDLQQSGVERMVSLPPTPVRSMRTKHSMIEEGDAPSTISNPQQMARDPNLADPSLVLKHVHKSNHQRVDDLLAEFGDDEWDDLAEVNETDSQVPLLREGDMEEEYCEDGKDEVSCRAGGQQGWDGGVRNTEGERQDVGGRTTGKIAPSASVAVGAGGGDSCSDWDTAPSKLVGVSTGACGDGSCSDWDATPSKAAGVSISANGDDSCSDWETAPCQILGTGAGGGTAAGGDPMGLSSDWEAPDLQDNKGVDTGAETEDSLSDWETAPCEVMEVDATAARKESDSELSNSGLEEGQPGDRHRKGALGTTPWPFRHTGAEANCSAPLALGLDQACGSMATRMGSGCVLEGEPGSGVKSKRGEGSAAVDGGVIKATALKGRLAREEMRNKFIQSILRVHHQSKVDLSALISFLATTVKNTLLPIKLQTQAQDGKQRSELFGERLITPQRVFLATLHLAHQNNTAVAAAAMAGGSGTSKGGPPGVGPGKPHPVDAVGKELFDSTKPAAGQAPASLGSTAWLGGCVVQLVQHNGDVELKLEAAWSG
eukprot:gene4505-14665_t